MCTILAHITPFPRYSWCPKLFSRGFRRPIHKISKDFLTRETFFRKFGENFRGHQGLRLAVGWGGRPSLCRFACPASCLPASCPVHLPTERQGKTHALLPCPLWAYLRANGLLYCTGRENGSTGLKSGFTGLFSVGLLCGRAYLVKIGTEGANFQSVLRPVLLGKFSAC